MTALGPHPRLIEALRRVRDTRVEAAHDEPPAKDPKIHILHMSGLVRWHQAPAIRSADGSIPPDRWTITDDGLAWLDQHDKEN